MRLNPVTVARTFCDRDFIPTALRVAGIVGTLLLCINHGPSIVRGTRTRGRWLLVVLTYLVPYSVSIHGQYTSRQKWQQSQEYC